MRWGKPWPWMKFHGGPGVFFEARDRSPGDRSAQSWSDLPRVSEMHNNLSPRSEVLQCLNEEYESFARKLKFFQGRFVKNEDDRQQRMREDRRIRIAKRLDGEQHRLRRGALDDRGRTLSGCNIVVTNEPWTWIRHWVRIQLRRKNLNRAGPIEGADRTQLRRAFFDLPTRESVGFAGTCTDCPLPPEQVRGTRTV